MPLFGRKSLCVGVLLDKLFVMLVLSGILFPEMMRIIPVTGMKMSGDAISNPFVSTHGAPPDDDPDNRCKYSECEKKFSHDIDLFFVSAGDGWKCRRVRR